MSDTLHVIRKRKITASGLTIHKVEFFCMAQDLGRYGNEDLDRKADRAEAQFPDDAPEFPNYIAQLKDGALVYKPTFRRALVSDREMAEQMEHVGYLYKVGGKWVVSKVTREVKYSHHVAGFLAAPDFEPSEVGTYGTIADGKEDRVEVSRTPLTDGQPITLPTTNPLFPQPIGKSFVQTQREADDAIAEMNGEV